MIALLRKLRRILTPAERRGALVLLCLMVVGMTLETVSTGMVIPAIALMMQQDLATTYPQFAPLVAALGQADGSTLLVNVMLGLVGIYVVKNLFLAFLGWRQTRFAFAVQAQLSERLYTIYLRQPYTFHLQRNSAQLIRNVNNEVTMLTEAIVATLNITTEAFVLLGITALLLAVEPLGTLIAVLVLGSAAWTFHYAVRARVVRWGEARQKHDRLRLQHLQQGLGGTKDVKLLGRETHFLDQYREHNTQSARVGQRQAALQMMPRLWLELLAVVGLATLVIVMLAQDRATGTIMPTLGLFAAAAFRLIPSANRIIFSTQILRYNLPVVNSLHEELKLAATATPPGSPPDAIRPALRSEIRLVDVTFAYPAAHAPALSGLNLRICKGESVGFVGPSGSGKSTLVDVVLGLLTPDAGQVQVDGIDIRKNLRAWQDQIGYVPQSIYLTDDTLRHNVAFGLPDSAIDDAAVRNAIRAAQLEDFVAGLPQGLETVVGERGIRLSGGQRQRIGIARALYHDPAVLVLDEATSALDAATERGVMQAVNALQGAKTLLIVAHRLSTVAGCDRLYRLERGRVVEEVNQSGGAHMPGSAGAADRVRRR
jgi:ABC-type multidrug transport system fused ATPase/permease subunit